MTTTVSIPEHWQVNRLAGSLGAEITGPDLSHPTEDDIAALEALLIEHMVIFLPGQHPTVDEHVALGQHFGELEGHPNLKNAYTPHEKMFELAASQGGIADEWHTDLTFREEPARMSILHMVKCPDTGGDTMWSNLNQAYNELSDRKFQERRQNCDQNFAFCPWSLWRLVSYRVYWGQRLQNGTARIQDSPAENPIGNAWLAVTSLLFPEHQIAC